MIIIAHRGGDRVYPENSMPAVHHAFQSGADVAEIDSQLSKDNVPIVIHDDNLKRLFSIDKKVNELNAEELLTLTHRTQNKVCLVTLKTMLESNKYCPLLVHIKEHHEGIFPTLETIENCDLSLKVIVGVMSLDALHLVKKRDPNIRTLGFLPSPDVISDFIAAGVEIIRLWDDWITQDRIDLVHSYGKPVWAMTGVSRKNVGETSAERLLELKALGLDGVLANDVELAVKTLKPTI
jgi:glycerophosphoryl diester phosphodiesterase